MGTFVSICKDVRAQAGISGNGPNTVDSQTGIMADVVRWVRESYNEIQTLHENWNFLFSKPSVTFKAGVDSYPILLDKNLRQIAKDSFLLSYQLGDKERLTYIPYHTYKNDDRFLKADTGKPKIITETPDGKLIVYPTPNLDYEIEMEGFIRPDIMVDSLDVPIFNEQYHDMIKLLALMKYSEYYNVEEIYKTSNITYNLLLSKMRFSELPKDNLVTPPLVRFA